MGNLPPARFLHAPSDVDETPVVEIATKLRANSQQLGCALPSNRRTQRAREKKRQKVQAEAQNNPSVVEAKLHQPIPPMQRFQFAEQLEQGSNVTEAAAVCQINVEAARTMKRRETFIAKPRGHKPGTLFYPRWMYERTFELIYEHPGMTAPGIRACLANDYLAQLKIITKDQSETELQVIISQTASLPQMPPFPEQLQSLALRPRAGRPPKPHFPPPRLVPTTSVPYAHGQPLPSVIHFTPIDSDHFRQSSSPVDSSVSIDDNEQSDNFSFGLLAADDSAIGYSPRGGADPTDDTIAAPTDVGSSASSPPSASSHDPWSGVVPSVTTINNWLKDAQFVSAPPVITSAKQNTPEIRAARQEEMRYVSSLYFKQTPTEIIQIDEKQFTLQVAPEAVRARPSSPVIMATSDARGVQMGQSVLEPQLEVQSKVFLQPESCISELVHNIYRALTLPTPSPSTIISSTSSDIGGSCAPSLDPPSSTSSVSTSAVKSNPKRKKEETKLKKKKRGGPQGLHAAIAASQRRVWLFMTQWKPFDKKDIELFMEILLREVDQEDAKQGAPRPYWFVWDSYSIHNSSRRLFLPNSLGSRHVLIELPPSSPFLNMTEDLWRYMFGRVKKAISQSPVIFNGRMLKTAVKDALAHISPKLCHNEWEKVLCFVNDCLEGNIINAKIHVEVDNDRKCLPPSEDEQFEWPYYHIHHWKHEARAETIITDVTTATGKLSRFKNRYVTGQGNSMMFAQQKTPSSSSAPT